MEKNIMQQIGKRLRRQREKINMTREEFAEKACISPQFLAEIENGKNDLFLFLCYTKTIGQKDGENNHNN